MAKKPAEVTDTELQILDVLWEEREPVGIREIAESIYGQHSASLHATVKSLLDRLAEKGYVASDRSRHAHRFSARIDRDRYVGKQLQLLADSHFGGALTPMLLAMVDRLKLRPGDRATIRKIIDGIK